ncbi:GABA permease-like protein [Xylariaceae sp. FL0804]|nr:GABA permease-like protein [Xylariaceae sp. FL0804]
MSKELDLHVATRARVPESNGGAEYVGTDYTYNDQRDMRRMGKKQELRRNFPFPSILGFVAIAMGTWEVTLSATAAGLTDGGTGGMVWTFLGTHFCFGTVVLSLAEMSSMAPTTGGQYHWASEFTPRSRQKAISYVSGWMSTFSWQCGTCPGMFPLGTQVQGLIALTHDSYDPAPWQGYLLVILMVSIGLLLNTWGAKQLPLVEGIILVFHIIGFIAVLAVLWAISPRNTARKVFFGFQDAGGWSSLGLSMLVSQVTAIYGLIGSDGAAHMSEETKDAAVIVPRCIVWSYSRSGVPYIYVFATGTGSRGGAVDLTAVILVLGLAGATAFFTSTSRQAFAFARHGGLPACLWIGAVHPRLMIPLNAILVTYGFMILLSLVNLGSTVAFSAMISLQLFALMSTYGISISCLALKRMRNEPLPPSRFSLGRFSLPVHLFAFVYIFIVNIFICFPVAVPVNAQNLN